MLIYSAALIVSGASVSVTWTPIAIGGGGYITGSLVNAATGDTWFRTDVGGVYYFDETSSRFMPVTQWMPSSTNPPFSNSFYFSCETFAIDLLNPQVLYMALGKE